MIAKKSIGKRFPKAVAYDLSARGVPSELLATNLVPGTKRELVQQFEACAALRPTVTKVVLKVAISIHPDEHLTSEQWLVAGLKFLDLMGYTNHPYMITRHNDTDHEHIHLLIGRVGFYGQVASDSNDYRRQEQVMRQLEKDFGLRAVRASKDAHCKSATRNELEMSVRTGQSPIRLRMQTLSDAAAENCTSISEYFCRLETMGLELIPVIQLEGKKLSGLSYRLDGQTMKGSDLGKGFTPTGLAKRGITYEQIRDYAAIRRSLDRERDRTFGRPDEIVPGSQSVGGSLDDNRAGMPSPSEPERGSTGDAHVDAEDGIQTGSGPLPAVKPNLDPSDRNGTIAGESRHRDFSSRAGPSTDYPPTTIHAFRDGNPDGMPFSSSYNRILDLVAVEGSAPRKESRTSTAVMKHLTALATDMIELGIQDSATGLMSTRQIAVSSVDDKLIGYLRRQNALGNHIFVRPTGADAMVVIDDLKEDRIAEMNQDGFEPAAVIETSPGNFQSWIRLDSQPLNDEILLEVSRELTKKYGGDPGGIGAHRFGRLAGFTNRKPAHFRNGMYPFVLIRSCLGRIATRAQELISAIRKRLRQATSQGLEVRSISAPALAPRQRRSQTVRSRYQQLARSIDERYPEAADQSKIDWMISLSLVSDGFGVDEIAEAILQFSPNLMLRKGRHAAAYASRTAAKAFALSKVPTRTDEVQAERANSLRL